mmetsp:Transcript_83605/g.241451  ORF Transcript_83605/g.241451 Transcript_83605/m.241451 type:complete len:238 (-) Transcript_83605:33-746(-)
MREGRRPHRWRLRADELLTACAAELERLSEEVKREGQEAAEALRHLHARSSADEAVPAGAAPFELPELKARTALPPELEAPQSPVTPLQPEATPTASGGMSAALALLEVFAQDNTVMECNLHDYTTALGIVLREVVRLKAEQEMMERRVWLVGQLQNLVSHEEQVRVRLTEENEELSASVASLREALASAIGRQPTEREDEAICLVEDLAKENAILRSLLLGGAATAAQDRIACRFV